VGEGFTSSEHRFQQRPHRRPVGLHKRADLQGRSGGGQRSAGVVW
jgi:hypothetical protein